MFYQEMKTMREKVKSLLIKSPDLRDSDCKLIATCYYYEIGINKLANMSGVGFLELLAKGELPSSESIRRVRAKLQEEDYTLRGLNYKIRKADGFQTKIDIKKNE